MRTSWKENFLHKARLPVLFRRPIKRRLHANKEVLIKDASINVFGCKWCWAAVRCCFYKSSVYKTKSEEPVGQPHNIRAQIEGKHMIVTIHIHGLTIRRNQTHPLRDGSGWLGTLGLFSGIAASFSVWYECYETYFYSPRQLSNCTISYPGARDGTLRCKFPHFIRSLWQDSSKSCLVTLKCSEGLHVHLRRKLHVTGCVYDSLLLLLLMLLRSISTNRIMGNKNPHH